MIAAAGDVGGAVYSNPCMQQVMCPSGVVTLVHVSRTKPDWHWARKCVFSYDWARCKMTGPACCRCRIIQANVRPALGPLLT